MIDNESLPVTDDVQNQGPSEQDLLDAVMSNSEFLQNEIPLPKEEENVGDPAESEEVADLEESEEVVSEDSEEESEETVEEVEDEDAVEETATQEPETYSADDLDLDAKVKVKVDGEELDVSFADLLKGYQTDAHLSKKGRELGEAQKTLDTEYQEKIAEVSKLGDATAAMLGNQEQAFAKEYHEVEASIEKARKDGDTFEVNELKDKREQIQKNYWGARNQREGLMKAVEDQKAKVEQERWNGQVEHFQKEIPNLIPDFNEKVATDIREFAIKDLELDPAVLDNIIDPKIVKALNDFRILKGNVSKGTAKRKVVPAKKGIPTKKAPPAAKKQADKQKMVKARAFKEDASSEDQMDFLRQHASKSLNL